MDRRSAVGLAAATAAAAALGGVPAPAMADGHGERSPLQLPCGGKPEPELSRESDSSKVGNAKLTTVGEGEGCLRAPSLANHRGGRQILKNPFRG